MVQRGLAALLLLGLALFALLSLAGFLAWWTQPFEILSHFRPHYAVALSVLAAGLWVLRQRRAAIVAAGMVLFNLLVMAPSMMSPPARAGGQDRPTLLIWANLRGSQSALLAVAELARNRDADIVALTELPNGGAAAVHEAFPQMQCFTSVVGRQTSFTTLVAARGPCEATGQADELARPSDVVWLDIDGVRVVAAHPPPPVNNEYTAERNAFIRAGIRAADGRAPAVYVGDFNAAPWAPIADEVRRAGLRRAHCGGSIAPTWRSRHVLFGLAIDHAYVSPEVRVRSCSIGAAIGSDHWPLILELAPRSPG